MSRPRSYTTAAVLLMLYALTQAVFAIPELAGGADPAARTIGGRPGPPYFLLVVNLVVAVLCAVAAAGVWRVQKWGVVLGIVVAALAALTSLPGLIFAPFPLRLGGVLALAWMAAIIVLLLRAAPQPALA
ncbi:MAG TPA: hypothetical protein VFU78_10705 [Thermomicrobiales bacterium]|nr:hypothetical protein [Thermomicrobiales bacterium]